MKEGCPSQATLDVFVESGEPEGDIERHCADCAACRDRVAQLRADAEFLTEFLAAGVIGAPRPENSPSGPVGSRESDAGPHPDLFEGYRILGEIHRGGQGVVYRAVQIPTQRTVAIKMLLSGRSDSSRDRERFEREARIGAGLRHPNIVTVYDGGFVADGRYAFAMEYLEGEPLDRWSSQLSRARPADSPRRVMRERLTVMAKVCDAVQYAHQRMIMHRDLKPANIIVDAAGEPHVLDFGIARDLGPEERTRLTHTGAFTGTLAYASPEQVAGDPSRVDTRTDIYSLGVMMYEMVSGRMPYAVDGPMAATIRNIEQAEPLALPRRTHYADVPFADGEVSTIILKAMAKDPERRYQTAAGLGNDIRRYLAGEAIEARRDSAWYVLRKTAARHRLVLSSALLVFLLLAAFAAAMARQAHRLDVRGRELGVALSMGNIDRGRARVELGNIPEAESLLWTELLDAPPGVERWNPDDPRLSLSRAWWALWELYARHPCAATTRTTANLMGKVNLLQPVPGHDDLVLIGNGVGDLQIRALSDLSLKVGATNPTDPGSRRPAGLLCGAFTAGDEVVTMSVDGAMRRWDAATLRPRTMVPSVQTPARDPSTFSANGARLAVADADLVRVLDVASGATLESIRFAASAWNPLLRLSPDGTWLAIADAEGLAVRRVGAPQAPDRIPFASSAEVKDLIFSDDAADSPRLYFTAWGKVFMLDPERPGEATLVAGLGNVARLSKLALSGDGRRLAIAADNQRISLWNTRSAPATLVVPSIAAHDAQVTALMFAPDHRSLVSGHYDGVLQRWDISDLSSPRRRGAFTQFDGHRDSVFAVAIGPTAEGPRGYSGAYDRTVRACDLRSGQQTACSDPFNGLVESIALSPDGRMIAAAIQPTDGGDVVFLDAATLRPRTRIARAHERRCADLAFSPGGASLVTLGQEGVARLWSMSTMEETAHDVLRHPLGDKFLDGHTVCFSPDGRTIGWGGAAGVVTLIDPSFVAPRTLPGLTRTVRCVRFSPDGRRVAAAGDDSTVWLWDSDTGSPLRQMKGHVGSTYAVAFSPDGRMLASGGNDGTVRLWDASTGDNLAILRDRPSEYDEGVSVFSLLFTPDGAHLFVGGNRGYVGVWDLRHFDRHIAGNLEYRTDQLQESGRPSPIGAAARRWAERHRPTTEEEK